MCGFTIGDFRTTKLKYLSMPDVDQALHQDLLCEQGDR